MCDVKALKVYVTGFNQATGAERVGKVLHWADAGLIVSDDAGHGGVAKSAYRDQGRWG